MANKSQDLCYRTFKGKRYVNYCDIVSETEERLITECKEHDIAHRVVKHKDGFSILFIKESDLHKLNTY